MTKEFSHIILMKVGPYCGYSLDEIIKIKQKEEKEAGMYFWGYSGVFCRPMVIKNLVNNTGDQNIKVLFVETKSDFIPQKVDKFEKYSEDNGEWRPLPSNVLLVGNKSKPHFAITAKNLREVNMVLDLSQYCTLKGIFPNDNQRFDRYFKYRVDKACGVYVPNSTLETKKITIKYISDLVPPYTVSIR